MIKLYERMSCKCEHNQQHAFKYCRVWQETSAQIYVQQVSNMEAYQLMNGLQHGQLAKLST